jgi:DHA2 family methylenomycin A resistance protein-like MFS transporter
MRPGMTMRAALRRGPETARSAPGPGRSLSESLRRRLTLAAMCVATFMIQVDVTIVNVALPSIQRGLRLTAGDLEWVISAYALTLAALIPVGGALGDRYGRKRVFLAGVAVFALGSAACAVSWNAGTLIAFRVLQGTGGAAMLALTLSIITETFPAASRAGAIGTWAAIGGTGFGVGPVVGGVLLTFFGWASIFWVNLPFTVVAIAVTMTAVRESRNPGDSRRLDGPGVAASALGLVAVTLGLTESASHPWGSWLVAAPLLTGGALLAWFARWQRRTPHAMIPPELLGARSFVGAAAVYLIGYTAFSGVLFYVTLLYQDINGWSPLRTGLSWLLMNAPFLLTAQLAGRLDRHHSSARVVAAGCVAAAIGVLALSRADSAPFALTALGYLLAGAGFGVLVPGVTHVAMRDVPAGASGAASGVVNAGRQVGTSVGLAVLGTLGAAAAISNWHAATVLLPAPARHAAAQQAQNVAGARITAVTQALGPGYRNAAADAFTHGYQLAVGAGAICLLAAAATALLCFRQPPPTSPEPHERAQAARSATPLAAAPTSRSPRRWRTSGSRRRRWSRRRRCSPWS